MYKKEEVVYTSGRSLVHRSRGADGRRYALKSAPRRVGGFGIVHEAIVTAALRDRVADRGVRGFLLPVSTFAEDDRLVLVFPWIELGDVETALSKDASREPPLVAIGFEEAFLWRMASDLCAGLATIHALGVCHRDVKPSNCLLIGADGSAALTDFGVGLVCCQEPSTSPRAGADRLDRSCCASSSDLIERVGTAAFMAPEVAAHAVRALPSMPRLVRSGRNEHVLRSGKENATTITATCNACFDKLSLAAAADVYSLGVSLLAIAAAPIFCARGFAFEPGSAWSLLLRSMCERDPVDRPSAADALAMCERCSGAGPPVSRRGEVISPLHGSTIGGERSAIPVAVPLVEEALREDSQARPRSANTYCRRVAPSATLGTAARVRVKRNTDTDALALRTLARSDAPDSRLLPTPELLSSVLRYPDADGVEALPPPSFSDWDVACVIETPDHVRVEDNARRATAQRRSAASSVIMPTATAHPGTSGGVSRGLPHARSTSTMSVGFMDADSSLPHAAARAASETGPLAPVAVHDVAAVPAHATRHVVSFSDSESTQRALLQRDVETRRARRRELAVALMEKLP